MNPRTALNSLLSLVSLVVIFHICILIRLVPYDIAWGGRIQNDQQMYISEVISIAINLFLLFALAMKGGYLKTYFNPKAIRIILWFFFGLFLLNSIGNLFAETSFEKYFTLVTLLFSYLIWVIQRK